jgi:hypothetical protein
VGVALVRAQPAKSAAAASTSQNVLKNFRVFMRFILPEARRFAIIKCLRMKAAGLVRKPIIWLLKPRVAFKHRLEEVGVWIRFPRMRTNGQPREVGCQTQTGRAEKWAAC